VPDDDRKRRRLGDETKGRIADLASGWDLPGESTTAPEPPAPSANASRRKTQHPTPPASVARTPAPDPILDIDIDIDTDDLDSALDDALSDDPGGWEIPTTASAGPRPRRVSSTRNGPSESGNVDVSGVIPEKTQPPELIVPVPTVDASALGPGVMTSGPSASASGVIDRGGARGTPKSGPVLGARGAPAPTPPAPPARSGTRTSPPPPPGARPTGPAAVAPGGAASSSGAIPKSSASGPIFQLPQPPGPQAPSITDRLPLPANAPEAPPRPVSTPPRPAPPLRAGRAAIVPDDSGLETVPDDDLVRTPSPRRAVPLGQLDASQQATLVRDPTNALLGIGDRPPPAAQDAGRGDPTTIDPATRPFGRGDPSTGVELAPARRPTSSAVAPGGRLRTIAQLRRRRGVGGDMRYVLTAILGLRRARREIAELDAKQGLLQQSRRRHLVTLGRTAVTADGFDHAALLEARGQLDRIEEERARHAGQVTAADAELQRVTRDREAKAGQHATELAAIDADLAELAKKLEPLEKEVASVTRRAADLREAMRRVDEKIAHAEAALIAAEDDAKRDAIQAEIASLKADRKSYQKDEPELAGALDTLQPRIAKLEAARSEARRRRVEIEQSEREDQRRTEELLAAIGAKRVVVDRAAADAEALRDKILFELGERLYVDRPTSMSPELSPIDAIDVELGTLDRRTMELREVLQSVDRMKIARGIALWILLLTAIGVVTALALGVQPPF